MHGYVMVLLNSYIMCYPKKKKNYKSSNPLKFKWDMQNDKSKFLLVHNSWRYMNI